MQDYPLCTLQCLGRSLRIEKVHSLKRQRFADNYALDTTDKFAQIKRLYDIVNKNLKQFGFLLY